MKKKVSGAFLYGLLLAGMAMANDEPSPFAKSLELADWNESRFAKLVDGQPLTIDERLELYRLVRRLSDFDRRLFDRQYADVVTVAELRERPLDYRGKLIRLQAQARRVEQTAVPQAEQRRLNLQVVYETRAADDSGTASITTASVPEAWLTVDAIEEPVEVTGVFFKLVPDEDTELLPLVAAPQFAWYPDNASSPQLSLGTRLLGGLGVDVALLDAVKHGQSLGSSDAPAFYAILRGLGEIGANQLVRSAERQLPRHQMEWQEKLLAAEGANDVQRQTLARVVLAQAQEGRYSVAPFFNDPRHQVGQLAVFNGVVRRAVRIALDDERSAQAAGTDHYFELELFTDDSQNLPLVFCVRALPPDFPVGENLREPVRVAGFFFKSWRFRTRHDSPAGERTFPLFLGSAPLRIVEPEQSGYWGWILGLGFTAVVAMVWLTQWRLARADQAFEARTRERWNDRDAPVEFVNGDDD